MRTLLIAGLLISLPTLAADDGDLTATMWVARVLNGPAAAAAAVDRERAQADVNAAGVWQNPSLHVERQSGPLQDQTKGSQDFLSVEVPLTLNGRKALERGAAQRRFDATTYEVQHARARLAREALDVFIDVVVGTRRVRAIESERERLAAVVSAARRRADAGEAPLATALRLELELAHVDDAVAAARAELAGAQRRTEGLVDARAPTFVDELPAFSSTSPGEPAAVRALQQRAAAAAIDEDAATWRIVPDIIVGGGPSLLNTGSNSVAVGYLVNVGVELPVFDRGQGDAARARAAGHAFNVESAALSHRLAADVAEAAARATAARERLDAFAVAVERSASLFEAASVDVTVGNGDVVAFVDVAAAVREARLHVIALQEDCARAAADLALLSGALDAPFAGAP
jgi:cobalt-zinc-cadmium efflux system outer membrane protein